MNAKIRKKWSSKRSACWWLLWSNNNWAHPITFFSKKATLLSNKRWMSLKKYCFTEWRPCYHLLILLPTFFVICSCTTPITNNIFISDCCLVYMYICLPFFLATLNTTGDTVRSPFPSFAASMLLLWWNHRIRFQIWYLVHWFKYLILLLLLFRYNHHQQCI